LSILQAIRDSHQTNPPTPSYLTAVDGESLLREGLIAVDVASPSPHDPAARQVFLTQAGLDLLATIPTTPTIPTIFTTPTASTAQTAPPPIPTYITAEDFADCDEPQPQPSPQPQPQAQPQPPTNLTPPSPPTTTVGIPKPLKKGRPVNDNPIDKPNKTVYPFDDLQSPYITTDPNTGQQTTVYSSFHVPATSDYPHPWKKMASTVSAANKRYTQKVIDPATGKPKTVMVEKKSFIKTDQPNQPYQLDADGKRATQSTTVEQAVTEQVRKFQAFRVDATDPCGVGVRVFRMM
jgi:hypothetical protein